jgi:hypothetical protein
MSLAAAVPLAVSRTVSMLWPTATSRATLGGSLDAAVTVSRAGGRQDATIRATGSSLRYDTFGLAKLDAGWP